ncbi:MULTISPECIES: class I adenylate-forming enzyme family protein [unclassified Rhodococcus (in: high G+C Gram-positive bacteria)]|uniref:class I adenylate-forming enzyme family protein n=1 Tax=unclassified Rhodococcus (in: high G+C Gram-positive bacteria) TaxID=192944 RepID=UPI0015C5DE11|nr:MULTISPECIES: AMP-binding protein [unclassified Rhodococcus (in: high G+C Gram-positive bacteria)]
MRTPVSTIGDIFTRAHALYADRPAVRDDHHTLTYDALGREARRFANAIRISGVNSGARVLMIAPNSCDWVIADHGLTIGGYTRVGVLPRLHSAEVEQIADDIEPAMVIVDSQWLADNSDSWIPDSVKHVLICGDEKSLTGRHQGFTEFVSQGTDDELPSPDPQSTAWVMYTSGSTGKPKGVLASQYSVGAHVRNGLHEVEFKTTDVSLHTAPISHFSGTIHHNTVAVGGLNVLKPRFDAVSVLDAARAGEVTILPLVPTMITMLLDEMSDREKPTGKVGNVRMLPYSGSAIQPHRAAQAREYFGDVMHQFYGASESPLPISVLRPTDHADIVNSMGLSRLESAGRPADFVDVKILDDNGEEVPTGQRGEIAVRGDQVSPGYWRSPTSTAEVFVDGWLRSGDVGCIDEHGYLFIIDRRKDMIITGGFNVYPREVENVIVSLPGVHSVAVVGAPDRQWGEVITAVVVREPGGKIDETAVIAHCRRFLGGFKVPKRVSFVSELPTSGAGKVLKARIKADLWVGHQRLV